MTVRLAMLGALLLGAVRTGAAAEPAFREALVFSVGVDGFEARPQPYATRFVGLRSNGRHETLELPKLLIPREGGFAELLIERACRREGESADDLSCADSVRFARRGEGGPWQEWFAQPCGYDYTAIVFASPAFVATYTKSGANEQCNPRGWNWSEHWGVRRLGSDSLSSEYVRFSEVFGEPGRAAYAEAARTALNHPQSGEGPVPQGERCYAALDEDADWTVSRTRSAWVARLVQQDTPHCQPEADLAIPVDRRLTGQEERTLPWGEVVKAVPDAYAAFGSPQGSLALVASVRRVEVFDRRASPWRLLAGWPRAEVVAVQWARGDEARRWRRLLRDLDR
jgi:hypothetical protein